MAQDIKSILILNCDFEREKEANESKIFSDFLIKHKYKNFLIKDVHRNEFPEENVLNECSGIILTGSDASVYENKEWIRKLFELIKKIDSKNIPVLAVCFGFQAVAQALGGEVISSKSEEAGFVKIELTKEGSNSNLFKSVPNNSLVCSWHNDIAIKLPKEAVVLAKNDFCIQSFKIRNFYCTQFHPEFSPEVAKKIFRTEPNYKKSFKLVDKVKTNQEKIILNFILGLQD
jgi:GMP synthase (glutamine-hydrolysing)